MGTSGPGIFSDDLAVDVREEFRDLIGEGLTAEEATERIKDEYDGELDPEEAPVFLLALAATQWKTGHVVPAIIEKARAALEFGAGMERWEEEASPRDRKARQRALNKLAHQRRTPARPPVRIPRRKLEDTTLELGDVVAVRRGEGRIFFAVVDFHVDKGGRAAIVKLLPYLDHLPADSSAVREAAASTTRDELFGAGSPFFIVFNGGRTPGRPPSELEVVARGVLDSPSGLTGGTVTWWSGPGGAVGHRRLFGPVWKLGGGTPPRATPDPVPARELRRGALARLLIFWARPQHLNGKEVEDWARSEVGRLLEFDGIRSAELVRLARASPRYDADHDWLVEVQLASDADAGECVESELWRSWLGDLRLLGLRPQVVLPGPGVELR